MDNKFKLTNNKDSKKIFIYHKACHLRSIDASKLKYYFEANNCKITEKARKADYIIFITCAFKKSVEEENFKLIKKFIRYRGELIVLGCLPEMAKTRFKRFFKGRFIVTKDLYKIDNFFPYFRIKFLDIPDAGFLPMASPSLISLIVRLFAQFEFSPSFLYKCLRIAKYKISDIVAGFTWSRTSCHRQYYLRIAEGCLQNCSYCSTYRAIGTLRSKPLETCLGEYKNALDNGYRNFVILGDDAGSYGLDMNSSFSELLNNLSAKDKNINTRWHMLNLSPRWAIKYHSELIKRIKEGKIQRLESSIQSGSDRILKLMNRGYNSEDIITTFTEFKKANCNLKIHTQIIIGFPTETESDFFDTLNLVKKARFDSLDLFEYHDGEGSIASNLGNKINDKTAKERIKIAMDFFRKEKIIFNYYGI